MSIINTFPGNPGIVSDQRDGLMTSFDKIKLDGIEKNANNYIHPESHSADIIVETNSRKFISQEEKDKLKSLSDIASQNSDGLMSKEDKQKLDGIEQGANNYVHPVNHPASIIVQNEKMRFVSDIQVAEWNAKADTDLATESLNGLMSKEDKQKLNDIEEGANNYKHPATHEAGMIVQDDTHRFVSDTEKATWNDKADKVVVTALKDGLMSSLDKVKLDGIAANANNYVHPSTHPASMIIEDDDHNFATNAEKATWNAKADNVLATSAIDGLLSKEDKIKLDSVEQGANNYIHPEKHDPSIIAEDENHKFVTDIQIASWDSKIDSSDVVTQDENGLMSSDDKIKLDGIAEGANNYIHPSIHSADMITQDDTHRFVSDAEKARWNNKPDDKNDLDLGNVTNDAQVKRSEMGVPNGVATLDKDGKVPAAQLPSYVDDVLEFDTFDQFPKTGEEGKIYLDKETNISYRWSGSTYTKMASDLALGETASTAYPGNKGKAVTEEVNKIKSGETVVPKATDAATVTGFTVGVNVPANAKFTDTIYSHPSTHPATMITEDADHNFVSTNEKATWNAKASTNVATDKINGLMSKEDKSKLDGIQPGANNYSHPSTHPANMIVQDETHRFATDAEKTAWNNKASTSVVTTAANGLMSSSDKKKLDAIAEGANNYVHPASHAATMIDQDSTHRFVTDVEKAGWNAKASTAIVTTTTNGLMAFADKVKLDSIQSGANKYTHPVSHPATMITEDTTHRFVTDSEKEQWNAKASAAHDHENLKVPDTRSENPSPNDPEFVKKSVSFEFKSNAEIDKPPFSGSYCGVMNFAPWADQAGGNGYQLGFGYGANSTTPMLAIRTNTLNATTWGSWQRIYTTANKPTLAELGAAASSHTHPATQIVEDTDHKFVTDTQIASWNSKASTAVATQSANGLMSAADKKKLDTVATGANNYTHPSTHPATMITEDTTHKFVTDTQIASWNAKASTSVVTQAVNGLMSASDKKKLDGIQAGATNYTHPSTHPATMITEDTTHKFVTDTQISTWNAKAGTAVATTTTNGLMSSTDKNNLNSALNRIANLESQYASMLAKLKTAVFYG